MVLYNFPGSLDCRTLTHKLLETHECILRTAATDDLVLKHKAISIHSTEWTANVFHQCYIEILQL